MPTDADMAAAAPIPPSTSNDAFLSTSAIMAASSTSSKPRPAPLGTPLSATYPSSSLYSPIIKREDCAARTPITPPSAYLDFLKAMSPAASSPLNTGTSMAFSFTSGPPSSRSLRPYPYPPAPASARPALPSQPSTDSTTSVSSDKSTASAPAELSTAKETSASKQHPEPPSAYPYPYPNPPSRSSSTSSIASAMSAPPTATTFAANGQRTKPPIRRPSLRIPESPSVYSPDARSPAAFARLQSPFSAGPTGKSSPVTVRQVVTRTVVYTHGPRSAVPNTDGSRMWQRPAPAAQPLVGEAPKGKRKRTDQE